MSQILGTVITTLERIGISEENLLSAYDALQGDDHPSREAWKLLAEICFLLARHYRTTGNEERAKQYANEAVEIYESLRIVTMADAVPILHQYLPDYMHEGVVRHRFQT
jgi:hypothetical protein